MSMNNRLTLFSFNFFAPFNFLFLEQENFYKYQQNQGLSPKKNLRYILEGQPNVLI